MPRSTRPRRWLVGVAPWLLVASLVAAVLAPVGPAPARAESSVDHLVVSEVVTGGTGASDELIELYNPTAGPLPLEGLEVVYVTASGLTVSRRAAWELGTPDLPPGAHLLIANELGAYAAIADSLYASGIAATGGSVALRIQGASTTIDAVGWGTTTSTWIEGMPAAAPAAGSSLERRPGGSLGSTQDTDDNATDFVERTVPDPQNRTSPPTPDPNAPSPSGDPAPSGSSSPTPIPSAAPSSTASPAPHAVSVADARAMSDGTTVTIEATALTASTFTEGGGYVADGSAGIAVLLSSGSFERGVRLRVTGTVDDRFAQRTLRAAGSDVAVLGAGAEPEPIPAPTGAVGESLEGTMAGVSGTVAGAPTTLSSGLAYQVDDGSGAVRVIVGSTTGIDTGGWTAGAVIEVVGVVGQRDSTGGGSSGYRLQPRDDADVRSVGVASPTPIPSGSPGPVDPSPTATPPDDAAVSIAEARTRPKNARVRVRGTVTMAPGVVDPVTAVLQDDSAGIVLRVGDEVGSLVRGERIEVVGIRSSLKGMETIRVATPARRLKGGTEPEAVEIRTGDAGEAAEAGLVRVRGSVVATARRSASGSVSFELDDGSGPLRIFLAAPLRGETTGLVAGAWVGATGVLGQETTGAQPLRGYRVWPRSTAEVRVGASATGSSSDASTAGVLEPGHPSTDPSGSALGETPPSLAGLEADDLTGLHVGATLVHGPWPELGVAGLLWDGRRLVGIAPTSEPVVRQLLVGRRPPVAVELVGLVTRGTVSDLAAPLVALGAGRGQSTVRSAPADPPLGRMPDEGAAWVSLVGHLAGDADARRLRVGDETVGVDRRCDEDEPDHRGSVRVRGVALAHPGKLLVPCGGVEPAPALVRTSWAVAAGVAADAARPSAPGAATVGSGPPRELAAGLLGLGAACVAAGAIAARRIGVRPTEDPDEASVTAAEDEPADTSPDPAVQPLTLVSAPRERGSP